MIRDEVQSQLYGFLGDATANPDGDEWDHDRLRVMVDKLIDLPAIRGLMVAREATFRERYDLMRRSESQRQLLDDLIRDNNLTCDPLPDNKRCMCSTARAIRVVAGGQQW